MPTSFRAPAADPVLSARRWARYSFVLATPSRAVGGAALAPIDDPFEAWKREYESAKASGRR
jgi:hypothetical protein